MDQAGDSEAARRAAYELSSAFRALDLRLSAKGESPDAWCGTSWTVLGVWRGDNPIPVGVIRGYHQVDGGDWEEFPMGLWATGVDADDVAGAQAAAIEEMRFWDS
jgi:hypothetical protein